MTLISRSDPAIHVVKVEYQALVAAVTLSIQDDQGKFQLSVVEHVASGPLAEKFPDTVSVGVRQLKSHLESVVQKLDLYLQEDEG